MPFILDRRAERQGNQITTFFSFSHSFDSPGKQLQWKNCCWVLFLMRFSRSDSVLIVSHTQSLLSVIFLHSGCKCQACLLWILLGLVKQESFTQTQFPPAAFMPHGSLPAEVAQPHTPAQTSASGGIHTRCQTPAETKPWHLTASWQVELEGNYLLPPFQRLALQGHKTESKCYSLPSWDIPNHYPQKH